MFIISFSQRILYDYSQGVIVIFLPLLLPRGGGNQLYTLYYI